MTGNLTKDKEEMAARAPQAAINGHLASAASAMQPSLRRGEGGVWQHSAYRMGSDGERARPRLGGKDDAGAPPPQRLATPTPHRLPHSVYEEETLSGLDRAQAHLYSPQQNSGSSAVALANPERGDAKEIRSSLPALRLLNPNMGCNGRSAAGGCALSENASQPGLKRRTRKEAGNGTEKAGKNIQYGCGVRQRRSDERLPCNHGKKEMKKGSRAAQKIFSGSCRQAYRDEYRLQKASDR
ncbi:hypothetical protein K438DRAFT_1783131 [Mycena galopus ATCC 62051]|nr:hypothetical protein K438DRAFT_1783131 [Mycena galopus ATCC 62051]